MRIGDSHICCRRGHVRTHGCVPRTDKLLGFCILLCLMYRYFTQSDGLCELCHAGTYNDELNSTSGCTKCPEGTYSVTGASSRAEGCIACIGNNIASQPGSAECKRCQSNAVSGAAYSDCFCESGFYTAHLAANAGVAENKTCVECPRHGVDCANDRFIVKVCIPCILFRRVSESQLKLLVNDWHHWQACNDPLKILFGVTHAQPKHRPMHVMVIGLDQRQIGTANRNTS